MVLYACAILLLTGMPPALSETLSADVDNVDPTVLTASLPESSYAPTAGGTTSITATISVEDLNGCDDIVRVEAQVNDPSNATKIAATDLAGTGSCSAGVASYSYDFDMDYHWDAVLGTDTYKVYVEAEDAAGATSNNVLDLGSLLTFNYEELTALNLNTSTLDFGNSIAPGATSEVVHLGVENHGNVQIDTDLSGTNLSHATESAWIDVSQVSYNDANDAGQASALSTSATTVGAFDLAAGSGSSDTLYWWLEAPSGSEQWIPSGTYSGTVTVSAVKG